MTPPLIADLPDAATPPPRSLRHLPHHPLFAACTPATTLPVNFSPPPPPPPSLPEGPACAGKVDSPGRRHRYRRAGPPLSPSAPPEKAPPASRLFMLPPGAVTVHRLFTASYETSKKAGPLGAY
ncbi:MAG: hypothetical protein R3F14_23940 [Polyangiaceae bacterium]